MEYYSAETDNGRPAGYSGPATMQIGRFWRPTLIRVERPSPVEAIVIPLQRQVGSIVLGEVVSAAV